MAVTLPKTASTYISLPSGYLSLIVNGAAAVSLFARVKPGGSLSSAAAGDNALLIGRINSTTNGLQINLNATSGIKNRVLGRSVSTDTAQSATGLTALTAGTWASVGGVFNYAGDTITPYTNGAADNATSVTFTNTTFTRGTPSSGDAFSAASPTASQLGSDVADVAIWIGDIGAAAYKALHEGYSPLWIRNDILVAYYPLINSVTARNVVDHVGDGTVTGSVPTVAHPPVQFM